MVCIKDAMVASAVAALLITFGCSGSDEESGSAQQAQEIKCDGINECKGHSECKSAGGSECKGLNECKGQGWVYTDSEQECIDKGGTLLGA